MFGRVRFGNRQGQASVELVAVIPVIVALCFALWQGLVYGQAAWLAGAAARAAARAEAVGGDATAAARSRLPAALRHGLRVTTGGNGAVAVRIRVPLVVTGRSLGTVSARAKMESQQ
jgi:TadE-like protein